MTPTFTIEQLRKINREIVNIAIMPKEVKALINSGIIGDAQLFSIFFIKWMTTSDIITESDAKRLTVISCEIDKNQYIDLLAKHGEAFLSDCFLQKTKGWSHAKITEMMFKVYEMNDEFRAILIDSFDDLEQRTIVGMKAILYTFLVANGKIDKSITPNQLFNDKIAEEDQNRYLDMLFADVFMKCCDKGLW